MAGKIRKGNEPFIVYSWRMVLWQRSQQICKIKAKSRSPYKKDREAYPVKKWPFIQGAEC